MSTTETPAGDRTATARRAAAPQVTAPVSPPAGATAAAPDQRPLRKDAERNRLRILQAAAEVFTEQGLRATLDDVADRAGVGVGTVYRRFPDKEALVEALFTERLDMLVGYAERALAEPDPWTGLAFFLERAAVVIAGDRGLRQILMYATYGRDRVDQARTRMLPVVSAMVERAQAAGQVRADLRPTDVPLMLFMLGATAEYALHVRPEIWRRYLTLMLDALRPDRTGTSELYELALSPDEMTQAMRSGTLSRD
jgi:AcrR family transcriptional regulator